MEGNKENTSVGVLPGRQGYSFILKVNQSAAKSDIGAKTNTPVQRKDESCGGARRLKIR
jgi:hypothetical protein